MKEWFDNLQPRERVLVIAGAAVVLLAFVYLAILEPLYGGVAARAERVDEKQQLLAWMENLAPSIVNRPQRPRAGGGDVLLLFGQAARAAGLEEYLKQTQPTAQGGVRARFESVPFDQLVALLGQLLRDQQLQTTTAAFERAAPTGTVNARLTLERAGT